MFKVNANTRLDGKSKNDCTKSTFNHCITITLEAKWPFKMQCNKSNISAWPNRLHVFVDYRILFNKHRRFYAYIQLETGINIVWNEKPHSATIPRRVSLSTDTDQSNFVIYFYCTSELLMLRVEARLMYTISYSHVNICIHMRFSKIGIFIITNISNCLRLAW